MKRLLACTAFAVSLMVGGAHAATLRFAGPVSPLTFDPHGTNDFTTTALFRQVYDSLVALTPDMKPVPGLAISWTKKDDLTWTFKLREGVKFHDGSTMTADDVVFSIMRAKGSSYYSAYFGQIDKAVAVDGSTVEVSSKQPDPILPEKMVRMFIMSKPWSLANGLEAIPSLGAAGSEAYSLRHENGTGPMKLRQHDPNVKTVFEKFDGYWGGGKGNVTEATYVPITSAPTRISALLSGEVDLVSDVPYQDIERIEATPNLQVRKSPQLLWMQFEMDGSRDVALDTWDKQGNPLKTNPFKDVRVRQAIAQAIDADTIAKRILRGNARVVGIPSIPGFGGYQEDLDKRWPTDVAKAKALLAEAGYPDGFTTQLNCPSERYANSEDICKAAVSMLARIGIDVKLKMYVWPEFAKMLVNGPNTSFHLIGVASSWDVQDAFISLMMTRDTKAGQGSFNWALWHNGEIDKIGQEIRVTFDPAKRQELYRKGIQIAKDQVYAVFLYQPFLVWSAKKNIDGTLRSDSTLLLQDLKLN
ncbi:MULTISPECIES: ABC transporter substrate-binding protein [unclassified Chelatococcus]|uniref:ABC transporter substrate-binding protein n=1 Tax=unclassified Chelatococcus TaxID=2638111 RepID=UPI001BCFB8EC|nr:MULTISPECIES: ABC transporter substrate-binding protein [unclassified Chelatococcus]CAH1654637.1 SBP_bac_5 domain-containing protein [Hyphomicrobiales bacterium]MBS7740276.1 ABC transporter substrate-binding protein [Chelatococcus sp. HY11]MBX3544894.1 ABC transporter substrate-binding protein [Chelatococcus sp.]MCO5078483.1 ABC transporter substrate-binding protein [Chelatococcus sp.]CAH1685360.1 SBP_bac_5 domain-containing protein [Hyphomicrobiales bacterium]